MKTKVILVFFLILALITTAAIFGELMTVKGKARSATLNLYNEIIMIKLTPEELEQVEAFKVELVEGRSDSGSD